MILKHFLIYVVMEQLRIRIPKALVVWECPLILFLSLNFCCFSQLIYEQYLVDSYCLDSRIGFLSADGHCWQRKSWASFLDSGKPNTIVLGVKYTGYTTPQSFVPNCVAHAGPGLHLRAWHSAFGVPASHVLSSRFRATLCRCYFRPLRHTNFVSFRSFLD